ncbi:MAG: hypothetical protein QXI58_04415 [Candidatus Micrarchaeia archaeon]
MERVLNGYVFVENYEVGNFSIVYKDLYSENIPIQVYRNSVGGKVYLDGEEVGFFEISWEDRVTFSESGSRNIIVRGLVRIYD